MNHSKKIIATGACLFLLMTSRVFSIGCGVKVSGVPGVLFNEETAGLERFTANVSGSVRFSRLPVAAGCGILAGKDFSEASYGLSAYADYYALDVQLKNTWNLFSGFGVEGSLLTPDFKKLTASAGARFFAGMNWLFYDNYLEVYVQQNVVPTCVKHIDSASSSTDFMLCLPLEAGVRFHF